MIKRTFLPVLATVMLNSAQAQECGTGRYTTYDYFQSIDSIPGVVFGTNTGVNGSPQTLRMDVYAPANDPLALRPVVLVAFGGGFVAGSRADVQPVCSQLARLGYVAVALDYRVGLFMPDASTTMHAVQRCVHDMRGCIRYLRKTVAEDGNPYGIDPDRIIAGGVSAGAIGAVQATYMNEPSELPIELVADSAALGGMEGTSGPLGYSSDVMACYSLSGAIGDTSWIQPGDQPLCAIHETGDDVVPCYTSEVVVLNLPTGIIVSGGHDMNERVDHLGIPNCYLEYDTAAHVGYLLYDQATCLGLVYNFLADVVCGQPLTCTSAIAASIADVPDDGPRWLYPVPADRTVTVDMPRAAQTTVWDASGRMVMRNRLPAGRSDLDVSRLPNGVYLMRVDGPSPLSMRMVVSR